MRILTLNYTLFFFKLTIPYFYLFQFINEHYLSYAYIDVRIFIYIALRL